MLTYRPHERRCRPLYLLANRLTGIGYFGQFADQRLLIGQVAPADVIQRGYRVSALVCKTHVLSRLFVIGTPAIFPELALRVFVGPASRSRHLLPVLPNRIQDLLPFLLCLLVFDIT